MKNLVIIGAGEFGRELYWHSQNSRGYGKSFSVKGYIDDVMYAGPSSEKYAHVPLPLLNSIKNYRPEHDDIFICAIGSPSGREAVVNIMLERGAEFMTLVHNTSRVADTAKIGTGAFLGPYTCVGPETSVGDHVMLNTHTAVGHDAVIGRCSCLMSFVDVTGRTEIGEKVFMGSGSRTAPGAKIGSCSYVGLGSVILKRVRENSKVFGNPAVPLDF